MNAGYVRALMLPVQTLSYLQTYSSSTRHVLPSSNCPFDITARCLVPELAPPRRGLHTPALSSLPPDRSPYTAASKVQARCAVSFPPHPSLAPSFAFLLTPRRFFASGPRHNASTPTPPATLFFPSLLFWSCRLLLPRLGRPTLSACAGPTTLATGSVETLARSPASTSTSQTDTEHTGCTAAARRACTWTVHRAALAQRSG